MSDAREFLRFPPLGLLGKLRLGATIFYASKVRDWQRLEQIPVSDWLRRWSGARTFEKIWLPLLRAKLGDNYRETSAAFIWATIARMYAARRTGLKKEMFGYVPGGYARVLARFAEVLAGEGVDVRCGLRVARVAPDGDGARVEFERHADGTRSVESFDRVVLTTPAPVAARVCEELTDDERAHLASVKYQGIVCASLLLKRPLANFYVTNITDPTVPFTAVIEMSALVAREEFGGRSLVYLPKYVDANDADAFALPDEELKTRFLAALARMYPHFRADDVLAFRVSRVRHVFPLPVVGYSARVPPQETSHPAVRVVNSAHILNGTLNVNETVRLADDAAARLLGESLAGRAGVRADDRANEHAYAHAGGAAR